MTIETFRRLFAYDYWANVEALKSIRLATLEPSSRTCAVVAHIVGAAQVWLDRLQGRPQSSEVWPNLTLAECEKRFGEVRDGYSAYLDGLKAADLTRKISYKNTKGEPWDSEIGDVLMHVAMHGTYHRGQIASQVRAAGAIPAYTDFIEARRRGVVA